MICIRCDYEGGMIGPMDFSHIGLGWVYGCPVCKALEPAEVKE